MSWPLRLLVGRHETFSFPISALGRGSFQASPPRASRSSRAIFAELSGGEWDKAVDRMRVTERQLLSEADVQRWPDRHRRATEFGPVVVSQLLVKDVEGCRPSIDRSTVAPGEIAGLATDTTCVHGWPNRHGRAPIILTDMTGLESLKRYARHADSAVSAMPVTKLPARSWFKRYSRSKIASPWRSTGKPYATATAWSRRA